MRKILGLDLGTTSIGWALVNEADNADEGSSIIRLGVRVNPLTTDEQQNFEKGKPITTTADRTLKRSMRRNLQRYKLRRDELIKILIENGLISSESVLQEEGNKTTFETYKNRAASAVVRIELLDFAKVLLMINKKRGYKSSRKAKNKEEGQLIDGMTIARELYENKLTPGQYVSQLFDEGKNYVPDFYRSDLQAEFNLIWEKHKSTYAEYLTDKGKEFLRGKNKKGTADYFAKSLEIETPEIKGNAKEKRLVRYGLRAKAGSSELSIGELAEVLIEINGDIAGSSGYLGAISDRSKELIFNKQTVGQYLWAQIQSDPHARLKGQVFYRQDYLDEFEKIWTEQAKHHAILSLELKAEIRDTIIFYQRRLKSQKGLISFCEFEQREIKDLATGKMKKVGLRVCPRSSPLFQEFKIWQTLNSLEVTDKSKNEKWRLEQEEKELLFVELNSRTEIKKAEVLKFLYGKEARGLDLNYEKIEGNKTNTAFYKAFARIVEASGHEELDLEKENASTISRSISEIFSSMGINTSVLHFDSSIERKEMESQPYFRLWHLLYSYEDDNSTTGDQKLIEAIVRQFNFANEYAKIIANIGLLPDYGSLSAKAIRKLLPHLKAGLMYSEACEQVGYNHSDYRTKEEQANRKLLDRLDVLPKNSLRNPVVEKILNQMIHTVNGIIDTYGKPDEIRIELTRDLKKSADERKEATEQISKANDEHEKYRKILKEEFGLSYVSRNDIIRYKLYKELEYRGFKTLYSNTYISAERLFSKDFDVDHIIPQSRLFDDSFSNKTLESKSINIEKGDDTAYDFVERKYGAERLEQYKAAVNDYFEHHGIAKRVKRNKLLMKQAEIPSGFIDRELRDTQYITRKAKFLLEDVIRSVNTTTGSVTGKLREDWQLVDVMQELNWDKYKALGLTYYEVNKEGKQLPRIKDWTKRNDHRHHAMDALTVAFTKFAHVQFLNNMNARSDKSSSIYGIETKETYRDERNKLRFKPPIPLDDFRAQAKEELQKVLVSHKAKNKVVTQNINRVKVKGQIKKKMELTPRGQLHLETIYGSIKQYKTDYVKVGAKLDADLIAKVARRNEREALFKRLTEFENDPKKAFTGKNSPDKNPIWIDDAHSQQLSEKVKIVTVETVYTIRKPVGPDLNVDKVVDSKAKHLLKKRLEEFNGNPKLAFANLDANPIWMNEEKGIALKRVAITGATNAIPIHDRIDSDGMQKPVDFVNTGNNHHLAIYQDADGNLQDEIKSFYEVVERVKQGLPAIDKTYRQSEGWKFLFTLKQNELFVFPNEKTGFNPKEIDLTDDSNYHLISPNLFRVQKLSKVSSGNSYVRDYFFRHHLETVLNDSKELKGVTYQKMQSVARLGTIVKVRINHIGKIVQVGEY
jgi:CRISPR-associated endonuclease Csn1